MITLLMVAVVVSIAILAITRNFTLAFWLFVALVAWSLLSSWIYLVAILIISLYLYKTFVRKSQDSEKDPKL